jgi:hypothetical protein
MLIVPTMACCLQFRAVWHTGYHPTASIPTSSGALIPGADKYAATFTYVSKAFGGRPQIGKSDAHSPPSSPPPQRKKHKGSDGGASGNISDDDFVASK